MASFFGKSRQVRWVRKVLWAFVLTLTLTLTCHAQVASIYSFQGDVDVRRGGSTAWQPVVPFDTFKAGDTLRTGDTGEAAIKFEDGALVRLGRLSAITFQEVGPKKDPGVFQSEGKAHYFTRGARREPLIRTPTVNAAIFGTELVVDVSSTESTIQVLHGGVSVVHGTDQRVLVAGEQIQGNSNGLRDKTPIVSSVDTVQWMITTPVVLDEAGDDPGYASSCASKGTVSPLHQQVLSAIQELRSNGSSIRLAALSSSGSADSPCDHALAAAVLGLYKLRQNDLQGAWGALRDSRSSGVTLVNTYLLSSLVNQSEGNLEEALTDVMAARSLAPNSPDLYDRQAELLLSLDRHGDAMQVLTERTSRFGSSALSLILEGYSDLARKRYTHAEAVFNQALDRDSSQSLGYLGKGLSAVARQDYPRAKELFSQAIQMSPQSSTYRSYLAKLFFEDDHSRSALEEYSAAIELDPHDPTPLLYRGFALVALNRPIEALQDVEHSITLNDDRAVYRSRLLLDKDIAVRSAGLSKVFADIGFQGVARIEAIRSISSDYSNFSAHRLLSDSYQSIINYEARASEIRIADLLSPLSFNLFTSSGEVASFGDYNALFDKRETRKSFGFEGVSPHERFSASASATGKGDTFGYLMNYSPYWADGHRSGRFEQDHALRGALQLEPTFGVRGLLDGKLRLREATGVTEQDYQEDVDEGSLRAGGKIDISPNFTLLAQGELANTRNKASARTLQWALFRDPSGQQIEDAFDVNVDENTRGKVRFGSLAVQLIGTSDYLDSITGVETLRADTNREESSSALFDDEQAQPFEVPLESRGTGQLLSGYLYHYFSVKAPRLATLTAGMTAAHVERDDSEVAPFVDGEHTHNAVDPKLGLVVTPWSWITGRAMYSEGLRKSVLQDVSSLEPTLVGGINQRYNDLSATQSRNLGFGIDVKDRGSLYGGIEYVRRNLAEPYTSTYDVFTLGSDEITSSIESEPSAEFHSYVDLWRSYLYSVLDSQWVMTIDFEGSNYKSTDPSFQQRAQTALVRPGIRYFLGDHWSVLGNLRYRQQTLNLSDDPGSAVMVDFGLFYRFSERHGGISLRAQNIFGAPYEPDNFLGIEDLTTNNRTFIAAVNYNF